MRFLHQLAIIVLALAIGSLHLALDAILFHFHLSPFATFNGRSVFMPLPILFILNFAGFVGLTVLYVMATFVRPNLVRLIDFLLLLMTLATLFGWNRFGRPNPRGLGTVAVTLEIVLTIVIVLHLVFASARRTMPASAPVG
jgi:hypothetical protein